MSSIIGICAVCIIAVFLATVLKQYRAEYALFIILAAAVGMFALAIYSAVPVFDTVADLFEQSGSEEYFTLLLKALGICCVTKFASSFCKDSGYGSLSDKIELIGKTAVMLLSLPLIKNIVEFTTSLVQ